MIYALPDDVYGTRLGELSRLAVETAGARRLVVRRGLYRD